VLEKFDREQSTKAVSYNLVMALNFYGRLLISDKSRQKDASQYFKQSEILAEMMPFWYDRIDSLYLTDFKLD
jgi:hypothetical protein